LKKNAVQMLGQPVEHFALVMIGSRVPDNGAFGSVFTQLLEMRLMVFHPLATSAAVGSSLGLVGVVRVASLAMAAIEFPDFRNMPANSSSDSLRRLRRTLTCTLSLKSNALRK
jgi:hypothetical protein